MDEAPKDAFDGPTRIDRWILVFVREPTLWPVMLVVIGHAVALLAPLMLFAYRDGQRGSAVTLAVLGIPCLAGVVWEIRRRGPGALTGLVASTWSLGVAAALTADQYGLL